MTRSVKIRKYDYDVASCTQMPSVLTLFPFQLFPQNTYTSHCTKTLDIMPNSLNHPFISKIKLFVGPSHNLNSSFVIAEKSCIKKFNGKFEVCERGLSCMSDFSKDIYEEGNFLKTLINSASTNQACISSYPRWPLFFLYQPLEHLGHVIQIYNQCLVTHSLVGSSQLCCPNIWERFTDPATLRWCKCSCDALWPWNTRSFGRQTRTIKTSRHNHQP